ncbi:hypothetical protein X928_01500 [Petrotoga miotherma DSM 10691]|uniref:Uncharacterized protein n=1 Tax=Petrotoga miotherma DSM 10691 TaxID=1434326 RepID=A0A2K1PGX1_9BACT|nr:hypothetical protein X928_01500 [Petrotoga miotherma DSM 10691]
MRNSKKVKSSKIMVNIRVHTMQIKTAARKHFLKADNI